MTKAKVIELIIAKLPKELKNNKTLMTILEEIKNKRNRKSKIDFIKNDKGEVSYIKDTLSNLWFPVDKFPKTNTPFGFRPQHKELVKHRNIFYSGIDNKIKNIQEKAINGDISIDEARRQINTLKNKKWDVRVAIQELNLKGSKEPPKD